MNAELVNGKDVRVVELRHRLGFALESSETIGILCDILMQHLDRHVAIETLVVRPVHHPHPTGADLLDDAVVAEGGADEVRHCW